MDGMMATITFDQINSIVAAHHAREAAERLPLARACRAMDEIREALVAMDSRDRAEVIDGLRELVAEREG
jgi:hypothetical protein